MKSAFDFSCWLFGRWNKMLAGSIGYGCFYCSSPLDENVHWCIDHWSIDHCSNEKIHYECWPANCFYIQISHNFFFRSFCSVLVVVFPLWYYIAKQIPSLIWVYMNMWTVPVIFSLFAQNSIVCMWTMRNFYSYVLCKYFFCAFCHAQFNRTTTTKKHI